MPHRARRILTALLLSIAAPSMAAAEPSPAEPSPYAALAGAEARVAAIGFRLTTENAAWCPARQPQFGWIWGAPRLYDADRSEERRVGKEWAVRVDVGGRRIIKKKKENINKNE